MARDNHTHRELAKQLLALEASDAIGSAAAAGRVYEKLTHRLAPLVGSAGVRALFARSVKLTTIEFPFLAEVHIVVEPKETDREPSQALADCLSRVDVTAGSDAAEALYANLFGLITEFIGERLVRQVLRRAFPALESSSKELESLSKEKKER